MLLAILLTIQYFTFPGGQWIDTQELRFADMGSCEVAAQLYVLELDSEDAQVVAGCEEDD